LKIHLAAFTLAAAALVPLGAAQPAAADPAIITIPAGQTHCPSGYACLFRDYEFQGGGYGIHHSTSVDWLGNLNFNDQMSSWANDSGRTFCWYTDAYFQGESHIMRNGYRVNVTPRENDTASSIRPC
jgi:hypothetical protein